MWMSACMSFYVIRTYFDISVWWQFQIWRKFHGTIRNKVHFIDSLQFLMGKLMMGNGKLFFPFTLNLTNTWPKKNQKVNFNRSDTWSHLLNRSPVIHQCFEHNSIRSNSKFGENVILE